MTPTTYISGLDLGQQADHSALVTCEVTRVPDPDVAGQTMLRHGVRHIHRWPIGTPYPAVIADLKWWYGNAPLNNTTLVVDGTGVGVAIVDMIRTAELKAAVRPFTITAGHQEGDRTVPKKDLIFATIAALQTRRLLYAQELDVLHDSGVSG